MNVDLCLASVLTHRKKEREMAKKKTKVKEKKPAKKAKLGKPFSVWQRNQMDELLRINVRDPILNVLETIMPDTRPVAEKIGSYQSTMGFVLGWGTGAGPICFGRPGSEEWSPLATHFTIPVRPYKYEA